ncbi:thiamine pyrophosphate-binding protein [Paraburkholderia sp. BCC1884]|uniref:thiamine pyrophosphate-binding protein n=1 Tax=Paraburkholderia sp. BCC1884 TaxID=2562668 RepID=UPI0011831EA1|nr:thiamine pyrophosphate-binding protein [Paraburkholderia sp. BCC1884]
MQKVNVPASRYIEALHRNQVDYVVTVPDWIQLALHARLEAGVGGIDVVPCCNEDQACAVSAGLHIGGKNPIVIIQNQGFYACVNTIRAIGLDARLPIVFQIGQFGKEFSLLGADPAKSTRNMVKLLEPLLSTLGVRFWRIETEADLDNFDEAFSVAKETNCPVALIIGAPIGWN